MISGTAPISSQTNASLDTAGEFSIEKMAKDLVSEALIPVSEKLTQLEKHLPTYIPSESKTSKQVLEHVYRSGGKRIRPALYFFCCDLLRYSGDHLYPIAAVSEFVHTASLLHDDVVDDSTLRRNKPTANSIWGDQASVLVGDLIYSRASEMMAATGSLEIVSGFARAIRLMSEGELLQLEASFNPHPTEATYLKIVYCKTAVLIATACKAAAVLANASLDIQQRLYEFGQNLGIAFQLVDDALDYLGNRELFGKPTLSDLKEGKSTLPVILLKERAKASECATLEAILAKNVITTEDVAQVAALVKTYGTDDETLIRANSYTDKAISSLNIFEDSESKENLIRIAKRLVWRFT